jgi:hypothetical protein
MLFMISIARPRFEAWNPVEEKCFVSCATEMSCFVYAEKSTPRIWVDVDGIGAEGLRTAWAAVATSLAVAVEGPFGGVPLGREVDILGDGFWFLAKSFAESNCAQNPKIGASITSIFKVEIEFTPRFRFI